jgi:pyrrolidone-carboxylate peptidase
MQESVGYNDASFEFADERGFEPRGQPVSGTNTDTAHTIFTSLPLNRIVSWPRSRM